MAGKGEEPTQEDMTEKVEEKPLPSPQRTTSHPQHQGEEEGVARVRPKVIGQEAEEVQQPPYPPPEEEEVTTIAVEESSTPAPPRSQMAVATSLVKKAWYSKNSELVVSRTK